LNIQQKYQEIMKIYNQLEQIENDSVIPDFICKILEIQTESTKELNDDSCFNKQTTQ